MALVDQLNLLESLDLIRLASAVSVPEYIFRHALLQDAAYSSLLKQDRRQLHRAVGETMERAFADRLDELAPLLAEHFREAGDEQRALKYFIAAGDIAARRYAVSEAVMHYTCALQLANHLIATRQATQSWPATLQELYARRGRVLELSSRYDEALRNYVEMEASAREQGDRVMALAALNARATIYSTANATHDLTQSRILLQQAQALAHELNDRAAEAKTLWNLLLVATLDDIDPQERIHYGERALAVARELDLPEQRALILNDIWYAYASAGQWKRASAALAEAREVWRTIGNLPMLAENLMRASISHFAAGEYERAIARTDEAVRLSLTSDNIDGQANSLGMIGRVYFERGQPAEAIAVMERAIALGERVGNVTTLTGTRADLGWVYGWLGMTQKGLALSELAHVTAHKLFPLLQPWSEVVTARLHILDGDLAQAEAVLGRMVHYWALRDRLGFIPQLWGDAALAQGDLALARHDYAHVIVVIDDLCAMIRDTGVRFLLPDALYLKGRAQLGQGQPEEAYESLAHGRAMAEELGSQRALWPILAALGDVETQRGHAHEARAARQQAHDVVLSIANQVGTAELRSSFLNVPGVRELLDQAADEYTN